MIHPIHWYTLLAAYVLDLVLGDPVSWPHPVVWMGRAITRLEPVFRRRIASPFLAGLAFSLFLISGVWILGTGTVTLAMAVNPVLGECVQGTLLFFCLSGRTLEHAAVRVESALGDHDLARARAEVSMIVGRDVTRLDETGVVKAAVETVAENFVDGFVSPLFFAMIGGVPLALAYKMVNTLDSMVGYKNPLYILFGRASARIDDAANFIPARLGIMLAALAAGLLGGMGTGLRALKTGFSEGSRHKSPNSGYPEATFAGALAVRLGGANVYHGILVEKPFIGEGFPNPGPWAIRKACDLMLLACFLSVAAALAVLSWM
ncbi:MAG: adenosylcobinamide-phosphate synthase CbiB [Pseudomonadota bacterium]